MLVNCKSGEIKQNYILGLEPIIPELKYCDLSPISKTSPKIQVNKSKVCRLNFSEKMSVDASLVVPDLDNDNSYSKDLSQPGKPDLYMFSDCVLKFICLIQKRNLIHLEH